MPKISLPERWDVSVGTIIIQWIWCPCKGRLKMLCEFCCPHSSTWLLSHIEEHGPGPDARIHGLSNIKPKSFKSRCISRKRNRIYRQTNHQSPAMNQRVDGVQTLEVAGPAYPNDGCHCQHVAFRDVTGGLGHWYSTCRQDKR